MCVDRLTEPVNDVCCQTSDRLTEPVNDVCCQTSDRLTEPVNDVCCQTSDRLTEPVVPAAGPLLDSVLTMSLWTDSSAFARSFISIFQTKVSKKPVCAAPCSRKHAIHSRSF
ncbi:hypothetical protein BsWGS_16575 [Bradybaena similaris]